MRIIVAAALLVASATSGACDTNPRHMLNQLEVDASPGLIAKWWDGGKCEVLLLENIGSGKPDWLRLALALRPRTDAWSAETLQIAMGQAMLRAPSRVLPLVGVDGIDDSICFPWDFDDSDEGRSRTLDRLPRAIRMFDSYRGTNLEPKAKKCADALRTALDKLRADGDAASQ